MSMTIGIFEDPRHVDSTVDALREAGFKEQEFLTLGQKYVSVEADLAIRYKRASDILGIIGVLVGGFAGMVAMAGAGELVRFVTGSSVSSTGIVLLLFVGAAIGAIGGALAGTILIPSLMRKFGVLANNDSSSNGQFSRNGLLVAVNTTEANDATAAAIMRSKEVVSLKTRPGSWLPASPQAAQKI